MFIILSIYSKNLDSLTNFLKFFYKLKKKNFLNLELKQSQKKKSFFFVSVLQSPHVNKKSQEQFESNVYAKHLKIKVYQLNKFLFICKLIKTKLFFDITIKLKFLSGDNSTANFVSEKTDFERFFSAIEKNFFLGKPKVKQWKTLKKSKKKILYLSGKTKQTFFKLSDIQGEKLLNKYY
jgi:ribosomal protein S10